MSDQFVDSTPGTAGTTQDAAHMDALVVAQSYLKAGGIPGTSGTLVATQPATEVVINRGDGTAVFVPISATTVTMTASSDNYVDVTTAGAYTVSPVTVGAAAPSQAANTLRLYKATTSGSAITAVVQLATNNPVNASFVQGAVQLSPASTQSGTIAIDGTLQAQSVAAGTAQSATSFGYNDYLSGGAWISHDPSKTGMAIRVDATSVTIYSGTAFSTPTMTPHLSMDSSGNVTGITNLTVSGTISHGGHVLSTGTALTYASAPGATGAGTIAPGAQAGTSSTVSAASATANTDGRGLVNVTTGPSPAVGELCRVNFATPYATPPAVVPFPGGGVGVGDWGALNAYVSIGVDHFSIMTKNTPAASTLYQFFYIVEG